MRLTVLSAVALVILALPAVRAQEDAKVPTGASGDTASMIEAQIQKLDDDKFEVREAAAKALLAVGKRAGDALRKAAKGNRPELAARAATLLEQIFPPLMLSAEPIGEAHAGQPLKFKIRITNAGEKDVAAVRCLDGSETRRRYPIFAQLAGSGLEDTSKGFCANCNQLTSDDFVILKPGESFDPFATYGHGQGGFGAHLCEFTPATAGKVSITFICDYSEPENKLWDGPVERKVQKLSDTDQATFARVPKIRLVAKVELDVK